MKLALAQQMILSYDCFGIFCVCVCVCVWTVHTHSFTVFDYFSLLIAS